MSSVILDHHSFPKSTGISVMVSVTAWLLSAQSRCLQRSVWGLSTTVQPIRLICRAPCHYYNFTSKVIPRWRELKLCRKLLLKAGDGTWATILSLSGFTWRWIIGKDSAICHDELRPCPFFFFGSESSAGRSPASFCLRLYLCHPKIYYIEREARYYFLGIPSMGCRGWKASSRWCTQGQSTSSTTLSPSKSEWLEKGVKTLSCRWNQYLKV